MLALKPERRQVSALESKIATQRQAIATARQSYVLGRAAQAALKVDGQEWAALKLAVPEQSDIPTLLRTLEKNARRGARVDAVAQPVQAARARRRRPSRPAASTGTTAAATPVPVQLTFSGGYVALNKLVQQARPDSSRWSGGKVHATGPLLSINSVNLIGFVESLTGNLTRHHLSVGQRRPARRRPEDKDELAASRSGGAKAVDGRRDCWSSPSSRSPCSCSREPLLAPRRQCRRPRLPSATSSEDVRRRRPQTVSPSRSCSHASPVTPLPAACRS